MGLRYTLRLFKGTDAGSFRKLLEESARALGGLIEWGREGDGEQDLRLAWGGDKHTIYLPCSEVDSAFCEEAGRRSGLPWIELRIQDGSLWDYALYRGDECLDTFSVCPQYWESGEVDAEEMEQWRAPRKRVGGMGEGRKPVAP